MPSTKELRARIRSVSNTAKVTGAMQLIAASKMRRAQQNVIMGKKYAETIKSLLTNLSSSVDLERVNIPLLEKREIKNKLMILVTPDRGLAGALVGNINRKALEVIQSSKESYSILSVGRKGFRFLNSREQDIVEQLEIPDRPEITDTLSISDIAINGFLEQVKIRLIKDYMPQTTVPVRPNKFYSQIDKSNTLMIPPDVSVLGPTQYKQTNFQPTFPIAKAPENLNPLKKRIIRKTLSIDTRFRDNYYTTEATNIHLNLPTVIKNAITMKLVAFELPPCSIYAINKRYGNNFFHIFTLKDHNR